MHGNIVYTLGTRMRAFAIFLLCGCFLFLFYSICIADNVAVIEVKYRRADEVAPMVKNMLTQEGTITVDQRTNSLVISDTEEAIQKVRAFIEGYDKPIQQVTVHVRFHEVRSEEGGSVSADARTSGKHWSVSSGGKTTDGVDVKVRGGKNSRRGQSEYFIRAASGSPAYILAGQEIPYTDRWLYLCRRYARVTESVVFHKIESGFEVVPVVMGDRVSIDITPRISYEVPGREPGIIRFTRASTSLQIPINEWITIGGNSETDNEVIAAILETGAHSQNSTLVISLKVISD